MTTLSRRTMLRTAGLATAAAYATGLAPRVARAQASDAPKPGDTNKPANGTAPAPQDPALFHRFNVGSFECISFSDGVGRNPQSPHPTFAPEADKADVDAALSDRFLPTDRTAAYYNVLLVKTKDATILCDTGAGSLMGPTSGQLEANMAAAGVSPDSITHVFLTHAHLDHLGGLLKADNTPRFANARLVANRAEHDFWTGQSPDLSGLRMPEDNKKFFIKLAADTFAAFKGKTDLIAPGDRAFAGLEFIDARGHTPGHTAVLIQDANDALLNMVDCAHHFVLNFVRPEWTVVYDADPTQAVATRRKIFDRVAADKLNVLGYHMPMPGLGNIRRAGNGFEWLQRPWGI
jgi:glyoxylase-like metal-dependent hydrolase (beta-lactamase superfamily II)